MRRSLYRLAAMSHYDTLGVSAHSSSTDIRAAFLLRAKATHPDTQGGSPVQFQSVNAAFMILSDPALRRECDDTLGVSTAWSPRRDDGDAGGGNASANTSHRSFASRWDMRADNAARRQRGGLDKGGATFNHDHWRHSHYGEAMPESAPRLDATAERGAHGASAAERPLQPLSSAEKAILARRKAEHEQRRARIRAAAEGGRRGGLPPEL